MNTKFISIIAVCIAVVAASVAGVIVMNDRAAVARAEADRAESEEARASSEAKKARADESAEASRAAAKESEAKAAAENRKAKEIELETERKAGERAKDEAAKAKADAEAANARAREAADLRAAEKLKADAEAAKAQSASDVARAEADKAQAVAAAAADALERERLASEKVIAEAKVYEMRQLDLVTLERELIDWQRDLAEREAALKPERTAADLTWVGEREADVIGGETNRVRRAAKPLPENDPDLPRETRQLVRAERLRREGDAAVANVTSNAVVSALERLYLEAVREDRVVDAQYYLKNIKMYYPNWRYTPPAEAKPSEEGDGTKKEEQEK